jgi:uncharacterized repeat protein (TIGR01451 family)
MRVLQRTLASTGALALALLVGSPAAPAAAQTAAPKGAFADAFGLLVDVTALGVPVQTDEISRSTSTCPPGTGTVVENEVLDVSLPDASGTVATSDTLATRAATDCTRPTAMAQAITERATVLNTTGALPLPGLPVETALLAADVIDATASATCEGLTGNTRFVNLVVAGTPVTLDNGTVAPNTRIDIPGVATVILNEQTFDLNADGSGGTIVVNGVHIIGASDLLRGDIFISHAVAGVSGCPAGALMAPPGGNAGFDLTKEATPTTATPGQTVTFTARFQNNTGAACDVLSAIDHLNPVFEFVSTAGDFGTDAELRQRPGDGGTDVVLQPTDVVIAAGAAATQTFTVRIRENTGPGTYFNVTEIRCSQQGNFVSPPTAGVTVPAAAATPPPTAAPAPAVQASPAPRGAGRQLPETGLETTVPLLGVAALLLTMALRRRRGDLIG